MPRTAPVVLIVLATAALAGCNQKKPQPAQQQAQQPPPVVEEPAPAAKVLQDSEPLTAEDVDLYVRMLQLGLEKIRNPDEEDKAAIEYMRRNVSSTAPQDLQIELLTRATALAASDTVAARDQGIGDQYLAIKTRIEGIIGAAAKKDTKADAVRASDMKLLAPRREEIEPLQKELASVLLPATGTK